MESSGAISQGSIQVDGSASKGPDRPIFGPGVRNSDGCGLEQRQRKATLPGAPPESAGISGWGEDYQHGIFPGIPRNIPPPSCGAGLPCERGGECAEEGGAELDAPFALGFGDGALAHAETIGRSLLGQAESGPPARQIGSGERGVRAGLDWLRSWLLDSMRLLLQVGGGRPHGLPGLSGGSAEGGPRFGGPFLRARWVWQAGWSTMCWAPGSGCGRRGSIRSPGGGI